MISWDILLQESSPCICPFAQELLHFQAYSTPQFLIIIALLNAIIELILQDTVTLLLAKKEIGVAT